MVISETPLMDMSCTHKSPMTTGEQKKGGNNSIVSSQILNSATGAAIAARVI